MESLALIEAAYQSSEGLFAKPAPTTIDRFMALSAAEQDGIQMKARGLVNLVMVDGDFFPSVDVESERRNLQRVFSKIGLFPPDDFYEKLGKSEIVEIYDATGFQLYHNVEWLKMSSYSLLDVLVYPFHELFERPSSIVEAIWKEALRPFSETVPRTSRMLVPLHTLRERLSVEARMFTHEFKYIAPLRDTVGVPRAIVMTSRTMRLAPELNDIVTFI